MTAQIYRRPGRAAAAAASTGFRGGSNSNIRRQYAWEEGGQKEAWRDGAGGLMLSPSNASRIAEWVTWAVSGDRRVHGLQIDGIRIIQKQSTKNNDQKHEQ